MPWDPLYVIYYDAYNMTCSGLAWRPLLPMRALQGRTVGRLDRVARAGGRRASRKRQDFADAVPDVFWLQAGEGDQYLREFGPHAATY